MTKTHKSRLKSISKEGRHPVLESDFTTKARNLVLAFFLLPIIVIFIGAGALFYFFNGEEISSASVHQRIQNTLQTVVGDQFEVEIAQTGLSLISTSALSLDGEGVVIRRVRDGAIVANIEKVEVGLNIVSVLQGTPRFDLVKIDGGRLDLAGFEQKTDPTLSIHQQLAAVGRALQQAEIPFDDRTIDSISLENVTIAGAHLMRRETSDLVIKSALIGHDENGLLNISSNINSAKSNITLSASWRNNLDGGKQLTIGAGNINASEWAESSQIIETNNTGFGLDALMRLDARIPFDSNLSPSLPFLKLQTAGANLRLGFFQNRQIGSAVLNFQVFPKENRVELQPSEIQVSDRLFQINADFRAEDSGGSPQATYRFNLNALAKTSAAEIVENAPQEIAVVGLLDPREKLVKIENIQVVSDGQSLSGQFEIGLGMGSPSVKGVLASDKITSFNIVNAWPFHIAPRVKSWIASNVLNGRFEDFSLRLDVDEGRLWETAFGKGFTKEEFQLGAKVKEVTVKTIGSLPHLENANGTISIHGSRLDVNLDHGALKNKAHGAIKVGGSQLIARDLFKVGVPATLTSTMSGDFATIAAVSNMEPLNIARTVALKPTDLTGQSKVQFELDFDMQKTPSPNALGWRAEIDLINAASRSEVFGRKISKGYVNIKATPKLAEIKGSANVDGFDVSLDMIEPLNNSSHDARKRIIKTQLSHDELAKLGVDISTVVKGRLDVEINSLGGSSDFYKIDLTNADINLPWISWLKGKGISAETSFMLDQKDGVNTLSNFKFSGKGFNAEGELVFAKSGLISANLRNVRLIGDDKFDVSVNKNGSRYNIAAQGRAYDARAVINMVIHKSGLDTVKGNSDVTLTANFGRLSGFNKQVMENALVNYRTDNGSLSSLEIRGALNGRLSKIDAKKQGTATNFTFEAKDAGSSLAMVNIYNKMRGGNLKSDLTRTGNGPFVGNVKLKKFVVIGEERLSSLTSAPVSDRNLQNASGKLRELNLQEARFDNMEATITKSTGYLGVKSGRIFNDQFGLTFDGVLFDPQDQMNIRGTFMPLFAVSRVIGAIPIIGDILSNGKNSGLIGITYRLRGAANNPQMAVNPLSLMAPGIFKQIFQFQE